MKTSLGCCVDCERSAIVGNRYEVWSWGGLPKVDFSEGNSRLRCEKGSGREAERSCMVGPDCPQHGAYQIPIPAIDLVFNSLVYRSTYRHPTTSHQPADLLLDEIPLDTPSRHIVRIFSRLPVL
jgi:hypothetical protein